MDEQPLTLEEAIAQGVIDPEAIQRPFVPKDGVSVMDHVRREHLFFPGGWSQFRLQRREEYLADKLDLTPEQRKRLRVQFRDVPGARVRQPLLDLGAGTPDVTYNAAHQFLIEKGLVDGPSTD